MQSYSADSEFDLQIDKNLALTKGVKNVLVLA